MKIKHKIDELVELIKYKDISKNRKQSFKNELKGILESRLSKGKTVGVYWYGSHGLYVMEKDGTIVSDVTLGGRTIATPKYQSI